MKESFTQKKSNSLVGKGFGSCCTATSASAQRIGGFFNKKKCLIVTLFCFLFMGVSNVSHSQITAGFELDGNAVASPNFPDDWDLIYNNTSLSEVNTGVILDQPSHSDDHFTQGTKDKDDVTDWRWKSGSTPDKDDILHGGAALYNGNQLYFFADRYAVNGNAQIGFWFLKDKVAPLPGGTFSGQHQIGDILLISNFVKGGKVSVVAAYEWVGSGGDNGSLNSIPVNGTTLYALTNSSVEPSPWPFQPKKGPADYFPANAFYEGGIDLGSFGINVNACFSSFLIETRASHSINAALKDFISGSFLVTPDVTVNSPTICTGGSATLTATVSGGVGPFSFVWSNGETTSSITVTPATTTTYTVTVTGDNGCPVTATGTVTVSSPSACIIGDLNPLNLICNSGNYTISSATAGASYSWTMSVDGNPPGWAIVGSGTEQTLTFSSGNCGAPNFQVHFTLTVVDANGCISTCTRSFAPGAPICTIDIRPADDLDCISSSQYLLASYTTDIINPTFEWTLNGSSIGAGINDGNSLDSIFITSAGTYRFTITDPANAANSCFGEIIVNQDFVNPTVDAGADQVINCINGSATLTATASAGATVVWNTGETTLSITVTSAGTYTVIASSANGCTASDEVSVTGDTNVPSVDAGADAALTCVDSVATLTATASAGVTFSWSNGAITSSIMVSTAGTYVVTVTGTNGCTASDEVEVTEDTVPPGASAFCGAHMTLTCIIDSVQIMSSSPTPGATFTWAGPDGFVSSEQNPYVFAAGTYTVTVTDPTNGCTSTALISVNEDLTLPTVNAGPDQVLNCVTTSATLTATASVGATLLWSTGATTSSITVTAAGTFTVTATNTSNGCTATDAVSVTGNTTPATVNAGPDKALDCITTSVTLTATASAGTTLVWSSGATTASITVTAAGAYTVTATNTVSGCTATDVIVVSSNTTPPGASAFCGASMTITCIIDSVQIMSSSPTAGVTFHWTGPNGFSSDLQNPYVKAAGTYTVTVTNPVNGCTSTALISINEDKTPPPCSIEDVDPSNLICNHGNYTVSTTLDPALYTFSWSIDVDGNPPGWAIVGANDGQTLTFSAGNCGNAGFLLHVTLTVTSKANGCVSTCTRNFAPGAPVCIVDIRPAITLNCINTSQYILASFATDIINPTFEWTRDGISIGAGINDGIGLDSILISSPGTYRFTLTDPANSANTCFGEIIVTEDNVAPTVNAGTDVELTCVFTSATLTATSSAGATLVWNNGATTSSITVSAAGTYIVTATNPANGCTATDAVEVNIDTVKPTINAGLDQVINCINTSATLTASASAGASLSWSSGQTSSSITVNGSGTFTVTATGANGCTAADVVVVTVDTIRPTVNAGADIELNCVVTSATLVVTSSAGATLIWSPNGETTSSITVTDAGTFTVVATAANGCTASDVVEVTENTTPPGASATCLNLTLTCVIDSTQLFGSSPTVGVTYSWAGPNGFTSSEQNPWVDAAGTYTVTVTNPVNGCTSTALISINEDKTLPPCSIEDVDPSNLICNHGNYTVSTTLDPALYTFSWSIDVDGNPPGWAIVGANDGQTLTFSAGNCGNAGFLLHVTLTVTSKANGCVSTCTRDFAPGAPVCVVDVRPPVELTCVQTSQYLLASYATDIINPTFVWTRNGTSIGAGINDGAGLDSILITSAGTYRFTLTDPANGANTCFGEVIVTGNTTAPTVNAGADQTLTCVKTSATLTATASAGATLLWSTGATTSSITVTAAGTFTVTATNTSNGCTATDVVSVTGNTTPATVDAGPDKALDCITTSVTLTATASAGTTLVWSTGATTSSITVTAAGAYTVTATNTVSGCTATDVVVVSSNTTPPGASAFCGASMTITCIIDSVQIMSSSPTGGVTFHWTGPNGFTSSEQNPWVDAAGTYTVTVTNPVNGCTSTALISINEDKTPPPCNIGDVDPSNLICNHGNYTVSTTLDPALYTFSWSISVDGNPPGWAIIGSTTGSSITFSAGNCGNPGFLLHVNLTVTSKANGCITTCSKTFAPGAPVCVVDVRPPVELTCVQTAQYLLASYATDIINPTFVWTRNGTSIGAGINDGAGLDSILITSAGTYRFTLTDPANGANTCFGEVIVTGNTTAPTVNAGADQTLTCVKTSATLTATASAGATLLWSTGATTSSITVTAAGTFTVTATNTSNGCTATDAVSVTGNTTPATVNAGADQILTCIKTSATLVATASAGTTLVWSSGQTTSSITVTTAGTFTVTATNISNGCTATDAVTVSVNTTAPTVNAGADKVINCINTSATLTATASAGTTVAWSSGQTTSSITVTAAGTYTVTATNTANGCTATDAVTVTSDVTPPNCSLGCTCDKSLCPGKTETLCAITGYAGYAWNTGATTACIDITTAGVYTVTVTKANGCTSTCSKTIVAGTNPSCDITGLDSICEGGSATFAAPAGNAYHWSNGAASSSITVYQSGTYSVTVTNAGGCSSTCSKTLTVNEEPSCNITGNLVICDGDETTLCAEAGAASYLWSNGATTQCITVDSLGFYTVTVTNAAGCTSSCTVCVTPGACRIIAGGLEVRAYPNPFDTYTTIEFIRKDKTDYTTIEIINLTGSRVAVVFNGIAEQGVLYKVPFDGNNLPVGMYLYKIQNGDKSTILNGRLSLMK